MIDSALTPITEELRERRAALLRDLRARPDGLGWCHRLNDLYDGTIRALVSALGADERPFALIATGGYGRREMAPWSDIDISVIPGVGMGSAGDAIIRQVFQAIHAVFSAIHIEVGYAYRPLGEIEGIDPTTRTGLLDARHIVGDEVLTDALERQLDLSNSPGEFILAKMAERRRAHERTHDTPLAAEPHLKEGAGGLRSFHAANWIRMAMGESTLRPGSNMERLLTVRNLLHEVAGRNQDHLTHARRGEIAEIMGETVDEFAGRNADAMTRLHSRYQRQLSRIHRSRFTLMENVEAINGEIRIGGGMDAAQAAVGIATATRLGLTVDDLPFGVTPPRSGAGALHAFSTGEETIRNLDRCGILDDILPELTNCRTLFSGDPLHAYSIFEHTLRVVRYLDQPLEEFLVGVKAEIRDPDALYFAALMHDVGKIVSEKDHSRIGMEMAEAASDRLNIAEGTRATAAWLIQEHLTLAKAARLRDVRNPATISEIATVTQTPERLAMLTLLTAADIAAVNPHAWTQVQATFLRELYEGTRHALVEGPPTADTESARRRLVRQLRAEADPVALQSFLDSLPGHYLAGTPTETVKTHLAMTRMARAEGDVIDITHETERDATSVTVVTRDRGGLLADLLGVIYAADLSLLSIQAATTEDASPMAIDTFLIAFSERAVPTRTADRLRRSLGDMLSGRLHSDEILRASGKDPERGQEILKWTYRPDAPPQPGILEIRAPRGRGMAYRVARRISERGWRVVSARVGQWAGRGAATFYIEDTEGNAPTLDAVTDAFGDQTSST